MRIGQFLGEVSAYDGEGQINSSSVCFNGRIEDTRFRPRFGYRTIATSPSGFEACHLFEFVSGYSGNTNVTECLSIEKRSGTVKPYSVNATTGARTEITNGGTALDLPDKEHVCAVFGEYVYIVCPEAGSGNPTVWKHKIGDNTSYSVVQNTSYIDPGTSGSLTVAAGTLSSRGWETADVVAISLIGSAGINAGITDIASSGVLEVSATGYNRVGQHRTKVEVTFSSAVDLSGSDYISLVVQTGNIYTSFERTNIKGRIFQGSYTEADTFEHFNSGVSEVEIVMRVKGITRGSVTKIEFTIGGATADVATGLAFKVQPLKLGGTYLEASASGDRLWDGNLDGDGITYGFRYKNGATYSALFRNTITAAQSQGYRNSTYSCPLGGRITLSTTVSTGAYTDVEFVRNTNDGTKWYIIGTVANSGVPQVKDIYEEHELSGLVEATGTGVVPSDPTPPFSGDGMTAVFAAFGRMAWGRGTRIDYSYLGEPLSLYSADAPTPDPRDGRQSVQWTLADNFADEVVAGAVAGRVGAVFYGKKATYAQFGTIPVTMSPPGEVQGSRGIAGRKAFDAYLTPDGNEGIVSVDPTGGLWFIPYSSITTNNGQGDARVIEMSRGNPDTIWDWLVEGQRAEFGYDSLEMVEVVFCKDTGELRISLGNRAIVLDTINGSLSPQWTRHQYALTVPDGSSETQACTGFENDGASATSVAPGDAPWVDRGNAFLSDDSYSSATLGFGTSQTTETLRVIDMAPDNALPIDATIDSQDIRLEVNKTGDLQVTLTTLQPKKSGSNLGSNLATGQVLTTTDQLLDFALSTFATATEINAGAMGVDIKFTQETWLSAWNVLSNWDISVSPASPDDYPFASASSASHTTVYTVTYEWIGLGTAPTEVWASLTGSTSLSCVSPANGTGSTDNGLGASQAGVVSNTPAIPPDPGSSSSLGTSSTLNERITLVAGVGTRTVTMVSTSTVPPAKMRASHTLTAGIYTPTPAVVRIDNVAHKTCYTIGAVSPGIDSGVAWASVSWLDPNKLWAIRSTGNIDELRYNTDSSTWIEGDGRDGGYSMPTPYWESQWIRPSQVSLLAWVYLEKEVGNETVTIKGRTDRNGYVSATSLRDSYKFRVTQQGKSHKLKFEIDETSAGLRSATLEFKPLSNQFKR